MRHKITLICVLASTTAVAQVSPANTTVASQQRQPLLSRTRTESTSNRQQLQREPVQIAQPANTRGYQQGVTFPQQQQSQPQQARPQPDQPQYQPQPSSQQQAQPGNAPQQGTRPTPAPTPRATESTPVSSRQTSRSGQDSDSGNKTQKLSATKSTENNASSSSAKATPRPTKSSEQSDSSNRTSSKSSSSSALEKIVKNVESGKTDDSSQDNETKKTVKSDDVGEDGGTKEVVVKKTKEEIAAEKVRAAVLKSADEATTVVANFLTQANDSNYSKAGDNLAPAVQKYFESEMSAVNGTKKTVLDELTAKGTLTMVTYLNTTVRGEGAVVETELGYENGQTVRRSFDMIKIEDDWKILLAVKTDTSSPQPGASTTSVSSAQTNAVPTPPVEAPSASTPVAGPITAEQAAARGPLVLVPPTTNPGSSLTTGPNQ